MYRYSEDYRDGSRLALERLIRTVVDETGGGLGGRVARFTTLFCSQNTS